MILSGFLSTMNVWADKLDDVRFSINDVYMTLLMTGWMLLFMGVWYNDMSVAILGLFLVALNVWCIRTQFMVSPAQYLQGMIPHHSMAVHMSKRVRDAYPDASIQKYVTNIINTQESEIKYMKRIV